jgi:hypothetical protein
MSLQDRYLREQIQAFRRQILRIIWFDSHHDAALADWVRENDVEPVPVEWPDFWAAWDGLSYAGSQPR